MVKIYYKQIIKGTITIADVPDRWKEEVEKLLESEGKS